MIATGIAHEASSTRQPHLEEGSRNSEESTSVKKIDSGRREVTPGHLQEAIGAILPEVLDRLEQLPGTLAPTPPEAATLEGHPVQILVRAAHIMEEVCEHNPPGGAEPYVIDVSESEKDGEAQVITLQEFIVGPSTKKRVTFQKKSTSPRTGSSTPCVIEVPLGGVRVICGGTLGTAHYLMKP
ncbi:hypothetical protein R1sor_001434 [Riccia sorocarpa]|uniref:Uncharacterized protein n=1 Tax=Riccia sorocarpa TaxID=122646 RepID=A0ABD3GYE2_9MARC